MISTTPQSHEIVEVVDQVKPLLAGRAPQVIAGVLAELLAILLAGHHVKGDEDQTRTLRDDLLALHCNAVRELTSINAKIMGTTP